VAIELISALQAIDLRAPILQGEGTCAAKSFVRKAVPFLNVMSHIQIT
jgi:histidine ammonia-lyase